MEKDLIIFSFEEVINNLDRAVEKFERLIDGGTWAGTWNPDTCFEDIINAKNAATDAFSALTSE